MTLDDSYTKLKAYLENKPASIQAIQCLDEDVEIGIVINDTLECTYFRDGDQPIIEKRPATNPDVLFTLKPEAIDTLAKNSGENVGTFGVEILKQYLAGAVEIRVRGPLKNILKRGYLKMMKAGGSDFAKFLATNGVSNITKIPGIIKNLRERS